MSVFTAEEARYLEERELGRLATVGRGGLPHVVPVSYLLNRELGTIDIGGHLMEASLKFRHVVARRVAAFVVDDVAPPYLPRSVEVRGQAEAVETPDGSLIRIHPLWVLWRGLDGTPALRRRRVELATP
ncbi:MAG TPA: PPOX class F420-dependent oxidoreductase [Candidatus Dormibacteraeota bacterium]|nr:PPOX class F420-dependent oxidoreductase [Candidatus Dormibacteraeota bacterium]